MKLFLMTMCVFLLAFVGLASGTLLRRPGIRRTCGRSGAVCRCEPHKAKTACDCG